MDETTSIPARLRAETQVAHERAESRGFVVDLMRGTSSLQAYAGLLAQIAPIYRALETPRVAEAGDPAFLTDRNLHRADAIESDLTALGVADWRERHPMLPATKRYVARIDAARDDSAMFTAHHYTRYLGDLSGGQVIATMLERHYGASDDQLSFYNFERLGPLVPYKRAYRDQLDALTWDARKVDRLVDEAREAFACNSALFEELEAVSTRSREPLLG